MEYEKITFKGTPILVFDREEAESYYEIPYSRVKTIFDDYVDLYVGVFYNNENRIIGINTLNKNKWIKQTDNEWEITLIKFALSDFKVSKQYGYQLCEWWNNNVV